MENIEGRTLKGYHVLEKVGQGGMTSVYKALDLDRSQVVALKVLSPYIAQDPTFKARFKREIEVLLKVKHENIVPILDYGEEDPYAFIVMPFYATGTLQDRLRRQQLSPYEAQQLMEDISAALAFAHGQGVIHRDVKPSNVLLAEDGRSLLSDFGFAHVREVSQSLTGSALIGTPAYMSPEQCKGDEIDERTDQYSLGVVLYQLCTGQLPFDADTPMALAVQHINKPIVHPRRLNPELPEPISKVLLKALSKDPDERFESIRTMNTAFQGALEESVDEYGNFVPIGLGQAFATWVMEETPLGAPAETASRWWRTRKSPLIAAALAFLLLPGLGYALANLAGEQEPTGRLSLQGGGNPALQATIDALSTQLADSGVEEELIQAAAAATMSSDSRSRSGRPTPTPGFFETLSASNQSGGGVTFFSDGDAEAADDDDGSSGGGDGAINPTPTPTPVPIDEPTPTEETGPTATNTPAPTATPREVNPNACQEDQQHANYCTPTP